MKVKKGINAKGKKEGLVVVVVIVAADLTLAVRNTLNSRQIFHISLLW